MIKNEPFSMKAVFTAVSTVLGRKVVDRQSDTKPTTKQYRNRLKQLNMTTGWPYNQE